MPVPDPRIMDVNGVPLISEFADQNQLASLAPPPIEPPGLQGVIGPSRATTPPPVPFTGRVPPSAVRAVAGALPGHQPEPNASPSVPGQSKPSGGDMSDFVRSMPPAPGGPQMGRTEETQTTSKVIPKAELARLDKAYEDEKKASEAAVKVGTAQADAEAARMQARDAHVEEMARQHAVNEQVRQNRIEMAELEVRKAQAAAKKEIDPNQLYKQKGTAAVVIAEIGRALGALGATLGHTENFADNNINAAINRNIDAQKASIANAREDARDKSNLLHFYMQQGLDERQAEHAARADYIEQVQNQLKTDAAKYKSPQIEANAQIFNAQLDKAKATELANLKTATVTRQVTQKPMSGAGGQQLPAGEATKLGEATGAVQNLDRLAKQFEDKGAGGPFGFVKSLIPFTDANKYGDDVRAAAQVIGGYIEGGKLTDQDYPKYMKMLPKEGDTEATALNKLNNVRVLIANRQAAEKNALAGAGYDVSRIPNAAPNVGFTPR